MRRLGINKGGYGGEAVHWVTLLKSLEEAAQSHGWIGDRIGGAETVEMILLHRPAQTHPSKSIHISAGIHGDEPAGPLAIKELIESHVWPDNLAVWLWPGLNPTGLALGQRENADGRDLNRDYKHFQALETQLHRRWLDSHPGFNLCLSLHEDWEADGFYLYELNPDHQPTPARKILQEVSRVCPIDLSDHIDGRPASRGLIQPELDPLRRPDWPEAFYLVQHKTRLSYTMEAPSDYPLATRVSALAVAVKAALEFVSSS